MYVIISNVKSPYGFPFKIRHRFWQSNLHSAIRTYIRSYSVRNRSKNVILQYGNEISQKLTRSKLSKINFGRVVKVMAIRDAKKQKIAKYGVVYGL